MANSTHAQPLRYLLVLVTAWLAGCGTFGVEAQPDFKPQMRYGASPQRVKVWFDGAGGSYLTDTDDSKINRPWKVVATYKQLPSMFTSFEGAARQLGCDAFWIASDVTSHYTYSAEGVVQGVPFSHGDQVCIRFDDAAASAARAAEGTWVWTAYQRPAMNAGWSLNGNFHVAGIGKRADGDMSLEKWFRAIPLGIGVRGMTLGDGQGRLWASVGGQVMVPAITLWKAQLAGVVSVHKAFEDKSNLQTLRVGAGALLDVVLARWAMVGVGVEQWTSLDTKQGPDGLLTTFRYGLAF